MALEPFLIISIILSIFRFSLLEESLFSRKTTESFRVCLAAKLVRRTSPAACLPAAAALSLLGFWQLLTQCPVGISALTCRGEVILFLPQPKCIESVLLIAMLALPHFQSCGICSGRDSREMTGANTTPLRWVKRLESA